MVKVPGYVIYSNSYEILIVSISLEQMQFFYTWIVLSYFENQIYDEEMEIWTQKERSETI